MQRNGTLVLLLLIVIGFAGYWALRPQWDRRRAVAAEQEIQKQSAAEAAKPVSAESPLKDGSFNPLASATLKPDDALTSAVLAYPWRTAYEPLLKQVRPAADQPGYYVYTFLDRTRHGVGMQFTYGWRMVGTAALAAWTQARVTGTEPPRHYGLPSIDEATTGPYSTPTMDEWTRDALADPATAGARYVVIGVYEDATTSNCALTVSLVDRQKPESRVPLYQGPELSLRDFGALSADQRAGARAAAGQLVKLGLAPQRRAPRGDRPPLAGEMARVAALLSAGDSWAVMEGIDQALALQLLYPDETLPLQAAAYGLHQLEWSFLSIGYENAYAADYVMRAYGLAQAALAMNPDASMSHLNWLMANRFCGVPPSTVASRINGRDATKTNPELECYRRAVMEDFKQDAQQKILAATPDWLVVYQDKRQTEFDGRVRQARPRFDECAKNWASRDFYSQVLLDQMTNVYREGAKEFYRYTSASVPLTQMTVANELAAILLAQSDPAMRADWCVAVAGLAGVDGEDLRDCVDRRDYYAARACLLELGGGWDSAPASPNHPIYAALKWMNEQGAAILGNPTSSATLTPFAGFEFTPAERLRFARRRDHLGPFLAANHEEKVFGSVSGSTNIGSKYLEARPDNAAAQIDQAEFFENNLEDNDTVAFQRRAAFMAACEQFPIDYEIYYLVGRINFYVEQREKGLGYIREYMRLSPFSMGRARKIAEFARRYGYHAEAVRYYDEFLKQVSYRYDYANARAWSLCEMGRYKDPEIRKTLTEPARILPGNSAFQIDCVGYLLNWDNDTTAAREAAAFYRQTHQNNLGALRWQLAVENWTGNTTAALNLLDTFPAPDPNSGLGVAVHYAFLCDNYIDLGKLDKAKECLLKAMAVDNWQGSVILSMGNYAYATGEYDQAIAQYRRCAERYGNSLSTTMKIANCYNKKGMTTKAIDMLEERVYAMRRSSSVIDVIPRLMYFYGQAGEKEKGEQLMQLLLDSGHRSRQKIWDTLESYRKLDPRDAEEIWNRIDTIMAGPKLFE